MRFSHQTLVAATLLIGLLHGCLDVRDGHGGARQRISFHSLLESKDVGYSSAELFPMKLGCAVHVEQCGRHNGTESRLGPGASFQMSKVYPTADSLGYPALGFDIAESDQAAFSEWTEQRIGKRMAMVLDGEIQCAPTLEDRLSKRAMLAGHFSETELATLVRELHER